MIVQMIDNNFTKILNDYTRRYGYNDSRIWKTRSWKDIF